MQVPTTKRRMSLIFESKSFLVEAPPHPLIDRDDGGHITITPGKRVGTIQELDPDHAIELMRLMIVVGEAMTIGMNKNGVDIGRINYQDNGNWSVFKPEGPYQHVHLYGRARSAKIQKYGQACYFPHRDEHPEFYASLKPLTENDVEEIRSQIHVLLAHNKYSNLLWGI